VYAPGQPLYDGKYAGPGNIGGGDCLVCSSDPGYFTAAAGANTAIFPAAPGSTSTSFSNTQLPAATAIGIVLTNGGHQAASVIVSNSGQPFQTAALCPSSPGAFTFKYSFSLTAAPTQNNWNGISDGFTLAFIDASSVTPNGIQWKADVSNVLVPAGPSAVTLEIDTYDDACGTPGKPCTGTYTCVMWPHGCRSQ
jgi:hypothetical protein